ncbi:polycystin-1, partial [Melitaea cinxia]|uniref:polycystin-1 n=1 Tax=Melitaea cinxia TaxID=113334 RepID=UPI001E27111B
YQPSPGRVLLRFSSHQLSRPDHRVAGYIGNSLSDGLIASTRNSVNEYHWCKRLALEKRALAINFSPQEAFNTSEPIEYTCEVLKCAESLGGLSLTNDTRYDYYSIFANPTPIVNSTCVPATGMFYLLPEKLNYTQAQAQCRNISAVLADVTSEQRTDVLAQVLASASVHSAFVGMKRDNSRTFYKNNGDALECITYRAWAPGHPKRNSSMSCVALTRNRTWKTLACKENYQALCELIPGGPYKPGSILASRQQNDIEKQREYEN